MHKVRSIQKWFVEIGLGELDWPAQSPDLNPIEHLWDEFERQPQARPNHPTSVPDLPNALVAEWKQVPTEKFQHLVESLPRRVEAAIAAKGDQLHISARDFGMRCLTSRCPQTSGHLVYTYPSSILKCLLYYLILDVSTITILELYETDTYDGII